MTVALFENTTFQSWSSVCLRLGEDSNAIFRGNLDKQVLNIREVAIHREILLANFLCKLLN